MQTNLRTNSQVDNTTSRLDWILRLVVALEVPLYFGAALLHLSFSLNLSLVIGPAVAGVLIASFGGPSVLLIDAGTFAVMALVAMRLPLLKRSKLPAQAPLSERLGFRQLWHRKVVRLNTLLSLV